MLEPIKRFLYEYFWLPIIDESVYYNPVNTVVYAVLFALLAIYVIPYILDKLELKFDKDLIASLTPYVFLGGFTRSLKDAGHVDTVLLETPFIYLLLISFAIGMLAISKMIEKRQGIKYSYITGGTGIIALCYVILLLRFTFLEGLSWFIIISSLSLAIIYAILKLIDPETSILVNLIPIYAHFWDASSTYIVLNYGGQEKHVLADFFIELLGPEGIFLMKGLVIFPAVLYITREFEGFERNYYLFLIALLGFALGTRNIISLITS